MVKALFNNIKKKFAREDPEEEDMEEEYVELDTTPSRESKGKIIVRPYIIQDFSDVKNVLDALRDGKTIGLVNIKPLKEHDLVELKRAINKLKKTCDAIDGDIAGFGDDYIVVTPSFAEIFRSKQTGSVEKLEE